ncbi:hypothetical protein DAPPUDRAFT_109777 [Daphnia pulex]|uniref:Uncharacterized protein n=1 Tax=Daphnia pulex TaxID=6669 RepID=E9H467_DAPPU|nr:hypothetical protein DAPPUDRAFT_109777 [Daphnia pulex]|eukprot:EFX73461.1 hypothetical protein DAPPUDRAFT_109777 [Daphnia pulex]
MKFSRKPGKAFKSTKPQTARRQGIQVGWGRGRAQFQCITPPVGWTDTVAVPAGTAAAPVAPADGVRTVFLNELLKQGYPRHQASKLRNRRQVRLQSKAAEVMAQGSRAVNMIAEKEKQLQALAASRSGKVKPGVEETLPKLQQLMKVMQQMQGELFVLTRRGATRG